MKNVFRPSSCGCGHRPPAPPRREPPPPPAGPPLSPSCCGGYLMQRIIASGRLHRRRDCVRLCFCGLPSQAQPPFTVVDVCVCAAPQWEDAPCGDRHGMTLQVLLPLRLRVRDGCGRVYAASSELNETVPLRFDCPPAECWRGQPYVQAAVRLAGRPGPCDGCQSEVPLEVLVEGYILAPCALGRPERACPPSLPWYPEPVCWP